MVAMGLPGPPDLEEEGTLLWNSPGDEAAILPELVSIGLEGI